MLLIIAMPLLVLFFTLNLNSEKKFNAGLLCCSVGNIFMMFSVDKKPSQSNIIFLQKIYSKLDEPDGLAGIATLREGKISLEEQILYHENAGRWADALTCYD